MVTGQHHLSKSLMVRMGRAWRGAAVLDPRRQALDFQEAAGLGDEEPSQPPLLLARSSGLPFFSLGLKFRFPTVFGQCGSN